MFKANTDENKVFFFKLIGDNYLYASEFATEDQLITFKAGAFEYYQKAYDISASIHSCNPIRLGIALNFCIFQYEVMKNHLEAK